LQHYAPASPSPLIWTAFRNPPRPHPSITAEIILNLKTTMETFAPGDRVVAINTDTSAPIYSEGDLSRHPFVFPDGPLLPNVVYYVEAVSVLSGRQGVFLTGMRNTWGSINGPWASSRFRKVQCLRDHLPEKRQRKQPATPSTAQFH
jgi:hypothetical protein